MVIFLAFVKTLAESGEKRRDGKDRRNRALVDAPRIQDDWSDTDGCFGLAAWP